MLVYHCTGGRHGYNDGDSANYHYILFQNVFVGRYELRDCIQSKGPNDICVQPSDRCVGCGTCRISTHHVPILSHNTIDSRDRTTLLKNLLSSTTGKLLHEFPEHSQNLWSSGDLLVAVLSQSGKLIVRSLQTGIGNFFFVYVIFFSYFFFFHCSSRKNENKKKNR